MGRPFKPSRQLRIAGQRGSEERMRLDLLSSASVSSPCGYTGADHAPGVICHGTAPGDASASPIAKGLYGSRRGA